MPGKVLPKEYWEKKTDDLFKRWEDLSTEEHGELTLLCLILETMESIEASHKVAIDHERGAYKALNEQRSCEIISLGMHFDKMSHSCKYHETEVTSGDPGCLYYGRTPAMGRHAQRLCTRGECPLLKEKGMEG